MKNKAPAWKSLLLSHAKWNNNRKSSSLIENNVFFKHHNRSEHIYCVFICINGTSIANDDGIDSSLNFLPLPDCEQLCERVQISAGHHNILFPMNFCIFFFDTINSVAFVSSPHQFRGWKWCTQWYTYTHRTICQKCAVSHSKCRRDIILCGKTSTSALLVRFIASTGCNIANAKRIAKYILLLATRHKPVFWILLYYFICARDGTIGRELFVLFALCHNWIYCFLHTIFSSSESVWISEEEEKVSVGGGTRAGFQNAAKNLNTIFPGRFR